MKKVLVAVLMLALLAPVVMLACTCCQHPAPSSAAISAPAHCCCENFPALTKDCASKIENFKQAAVHVFSSLFKAVFVETGSKAEVQASRPAIKAPDTGPEFSSPLYLSLSTLRI